MNLMTFQNSIKSTIVQSLKVHNVYISLDPLTRKVLKILQDIQKKLKENKCLFLNIVLN